MEKQLMYRGIFLLFVMMFIYIIFAIPLSFNPREWSEGAQVGWISIELLIAFMGGTTALMASEKNEK